MNQIFKAALITAALSLCAQSTIAQADERIQFDQATEDNTDIPLPLPAPKEKGKIEQYQQGRFYGYRLDDSVLVEAKFDRLEPFYTDFMVAKKGKKQGVINAKGETILPFEFDKVEKFEFENLWKGKPKHTSFRWLKVSRDGKFGLLDRAGQEVVPIEWDRMSYTYGDTLMLFSRPGLQRLIGPSGHTLLETNYDGWDEQTHVFTDPSRGLFCAIKDGKTGMFDRQNRVILPFEFERIGWVKGNFACVENEAKHLGLVSLQGKQILPFDFMEVKEMGENGLFPVKDYNTGLCGLADSTGLLRLPAVYASVRGIANSPYLMARLPDSLMAAFEVSGKQLTAFLYADFLWNPAAPNLLLAQTPDQNWRFLDAAGQPLNAEVFEEMHYTQTAFTAKKNGKTAFFSLEGHRLTDFKFTKAMGIGKNDQAIYAGHVDLPEGRVLIGRVWDEAGRTIYIDDLGGEYPSRN